MDRKDYMKTQLTVTQFLMDNNIEFTCKWHDGERLQYTIRFADTTCAAEKCNNQIEQKDKGRTRLYCSRACQVREYRRRKQQVTESVLTLGNRERPDSRN